MRLIAIILLGIFIPLLAVAQDRAEEEHDVTFGNDRVIMGGNPVLSGAGTDGDGFFAGDRVVVSGPVGGTVHAVGRKVSISGEVAENVYASGQEVTVDGTVNGNATLIGYGVHINGVVKKNLRATGANITLNGVVSGSAAFAGSDVTINGIIEGDVAIRAETLHFGDDAEIRGTLFIKEKDASSVPENVVSKDRVDIETLDNPDAQAPDVVKEIKNKGRRFAFTGLISGMVIVVFFAALLIAIAPNRIADMRARVLDQPGRAILSGFVALSCLLGSGIVFALTFIGLLLTPAALLIAVLAAFLGYVVGAYILGVGLWKLAGQGDPNQYIQKLGLAVLGAFVAAIITMLPIIGWPIVMLLVMAGLGGFAMSLWPGRTGSGWA